MEPSIPSPDRDGDVNMPDMDPDYELHDHRNQPDSLLTVPRVSISGTSGGSINAGRSSSDRRHSSISARGMCSSPASPFTHPENTTNRNASTSRLTEEGGEETNSCNEKKYINSESESGNEYLSLPPSAVRNSFSIHHRPSGASSQDQRPQFRAQSMLGEESPRSEGAGATPATILGPHTTNTATIVPDGIGSTVAPSVRSDDDRSQVDSADDTEEDVCFPGTLNQQRGSGFDFAEMEQFATAERHARTNYIRRRRNTNATDIDTYFRPSSNQLPLHPEKPEGWLYDPNGFSEDEPSTSSDAVASPESAAIDKRLNQQAIPSSIGNRYDARAGQEQPHHHERTAAEEEETSASIESDEQKDYDVEAQLPRRETRGGGGINAQERFTYFDCTTGESSHSVDFASLTDDRTSYKDLFGANKNAWWLDCMNPTDAEMKMIWKSFGIHPLTAEDIRVREAREKVELFKSYYFICFHTFIANKESEHYMEMANFYIIVFRDGLLTFHFSPLPHPANVRRRIRQLRTYVNVSADFICYALIDDITDGFAPVIHSVEKEADGIEDAVFVIRDDDFTLLLQRIGEARKIVMTLMRLLSGKADVIKMFAKRCNENWDMAPTADIGLYLGDIQDHIVTMYQSLITFEKILSRSHANYLAQLQVESVFSNNRVTELLSKITLLGTILVPLNMIPGMFGMNVHVPGEDAGNLHWFFGIFAVIVGLSVIMYFTLSRWMAGRLVRSSSN